MSKLTRFTVSLDEDLLNRFDTHIAKEGCPTRSKAISDLIGDVLVKQEWKTGKEVAAAITIVYDHHKRNLANQLIKVQHDDYHLIVSSQHVHIDHDNCLEVIIVKGEPNKLHELARKLKAIKGVKHASISEASTGKEL